jgi:hypothetical protein
MWLDEQASGGPPDVSLQHHWTASRPRLAVRSFWGVHGFDGGVQMRSLAAFPVPC